MGNGSVDRQGQPPAPARDPGAGGARLEDLPIEVPRTVEEDPSPCLTATEGGAARDHYLSDGFVVVRGVIAPESCARLRAAFDAEIKHDAGFFYRQSSFRQYQPHRYSPEGFVLNPLMNIQDLRRRRFPRFVDAGLALITDPALHGLVRALLGGPGIVAQSMYFEGNPVTWAHQDSYYLDGERLGSMLAAWIALEPIAAGAGRFYVSPGSHRLRLRPHGPGVDIAFHHDRYKDHVLDELKAAGARLVAPALETGDVLFWNALTVHGSLPTTTPWLSRSSVTLHVLPEGMRLMQFQNRLRRLRTEEVGGVAVAHSKDQNLWHRRCVAACERRFPRSFYAAKRLAVGALTVAGWSAALE